MINTPTDEQPLMSNDQWIHLQQQDELDHPVGTTLQQKVDTFLLDTMTMPDWFIIFAFLLLWIAITTTRIAGSLGAIKRQASYR